MKARSAALKVLIDYVRIQVIKENKPTHVSGINDRQ